jgi:Tol biopolymer transport system component
VLGLGRVLGVGLVGLAAVLIALSLADPRLGAEPETRGEGRIAFTFGESSVDHPAQLDVMDADGKNPRGLPPWGVGGPSWSPDGRSIAFGGGGVISTINADGRPRERVVVRNGGSPDWSPDGRSIAFERGDGIWGIWVVDLNDRRQRPIVRGGRWPSWSPDGRKLAFTRGPGYSPGPMERNPDLWVRDIATKKERRLVRNGDGAKWSPDGRQIAFARCGLGLREECFIYVMRSDGTKRRRLFEGWAPVWSPDGQELAFVGPEDAIIRVRLNGSGRRVLFGGGAPCGCGLLDWVRAPRSRR